MKIYFERQPVATAIFNFKEFKRDIIASGWDFKEAIKKNITLKSHKEEYKESILLDFIYLSNDWYSSLLLFKPSKRESMDIKVYNCKIMDRVCYKPLAVDFEKGEVSLEPVTITKENFLVTFSLSARFDKHLEFMLGQELVDYINFEWDTVVDLEQ